MNIREFKDCVRFNIEHNIKQAILGLGAPGYPRRLAACDDAPIDPAFDCIELADAPDTPDASDTPDIPEAQPSASAPDNIPIAETDVFKNCRLSMFSSYRHESGLSGGGRAPTALR